MEGPSVGSLALSGAGYKAAAGQSRSARPVAKTPRQVPNVETLGNPLLVPKIVTVDALMKEVRKIVHTMFCIVDPSIPSANAYENYSRQAFRFFTTTNSITAEFFHHKVVRLGIQVAPRLCKELFFRLDHDDLGEIDYPIFAQRIFLPEAFYTADESLQAPGNGTPAKIDSRQEDIIKRSTPRSPRPFGGEHNTGVSPSSNQIKSHLKHEYMGLDELERCIARRLEEEMPRSNDPLGQAFRFFTNAEAITFADFHRHLGTLQIQLSAPKCRELFIRFDKDRNGVIDSIEFATTLYSNQNSRPGSARSVRSYSSENREQVSTKQLVTMLRNKLDEISGEESDRFQQAFKLFGKPAGITVDDLGAAMRNLGLKMSRKQLLDVFDTFDFDKTGDLDVNKFVQGVMLDDHSTSFWLSVKDRQKVDDSRRKLYSEAVKSVQHSWTIADIERMLREKIEQRTSRSSDCFRQAFRIFKKVNGIKPDEFHAALEAIGLALTRVQSDILFRRFDKDGSGDIDLNEFIHGILPPDYTGISWVAAADELHRIEAQNKKAIALANPDQYMTEIEMESWSLDEIEMRIRDKIQQATSRSSDTFRQAYKIFKKASHVTMDEFRERLLALGFRLTPAQCLGLFKRYDTDNSNDLDLQEFCMKILPPDYTHDGDHWSHSEKYRKERHRQKLEYVKRSKNGLIMLPKFVESHRFTRGRHVSHTFEEMQGETKSSSDSRNEDSSTARSSTSSTIGEVARPTTPQPPRASRPLSPTTPQNCSSPPHPSRPLSPSTPQSCNSPQHLPSPRRSSTPASPINPLAASSPRMIRTTSPAANGRSIDSQLTYSPQATPPISPRVVSPRVVSPRVVSPTRPMSPRTAAPTPLSPHNLSRPTTPHKPSPKHADVAVEYEDEEILEDDEVAALDLARAKQLSRHRRKHGRSTSSQVSVRIAESVTSTTSTGSGAVGTAKHMPQRNHVLLIKRLMQATGKSDHGSSKSSKRISVARR